MDNSLQAGIRLYHVLENVLRAAMDSKTPVSIHELYEKPEIREVARSTQQVRDAIASMKSRKMVLGLPHIDVHGGSRSRVGFLWNKDYNPETAKGKQTLGTRTQPTSVAEKPQVLKQVEQVQDLELAFGKVTVLIGKNEKTGRVRITIESV